MNPFERFLRSLFGIKQPDSAYPAPNAFPQYERGPVTAGEISPAAWAAREKSALGDSLNAFIPYGSPAPKYGDLGDSYMGYVEHLPGKQIRMPSGLFFNTNPAAFGKFETDKPEEDAFLAKYRQSPAGSVFDPRRTFIHEKAHLANSQTTFGKDGLFPSYSETAKMFENNTPRDFERFNDMGVIAGLQAGSAPEFKAFATVDPYYRLNPREAFAQAFVNAWEFLQETKKNPKMDYRKFAGDLEANTPGMGLIVRDLLKDKGFENHPLRGKMFTTGENANATKSRKNP